MILKYVLDFQNQKCPFSIAELSQQILIALNTTGVAKSSPSYKKIASKVYHTILNNSHENHLSKVTPLPYLRDIYLETEATLARHGYPLAAQKFISLYLLPQMHLQTSCTPKSQIIPVTTISKNIRKLNLPHTL